MAGAAADGSYISGPDRARTPRIPSTRTSSCRVPRRVRHRPDRGVRRSQLVLDAAEHPRSKRSRRRRSRTVTDRLDDPRRRCETPFSRRTGSDGDHRPDHLHPLGDCATDVTIGIFKGPGGPWRAARRPGRLQRHEVAGRRPGGPRDRAVRRGRPKGRPRRRTVEGAAWTSRRDGRRCAAEPLRRFPWRRIILLVLSRAPAGLRWRRRVEDPDPAASAPVRRVELAAVHRPGRRPGERSSR